MVVITLVAVLATIGVAAFRERATASKSVEAVAVIQAIRAAQESYRAENQEYLDVTEPGNWYPSSTFNSTAIGWAANYSSHPDGPEMQALNVVVVQPVQYRYLVNAGGAGSPLPTPIVTLPAWPTPTDPWYVIQARANVDGDSVYSNAVATSFSSNVYLDNEGE